VSLRNNKLISNIYYSDGNFILCRFKNAEIVLNYLKDNDLLIRGFPNMRSLKQCLRITIGKADEMDQLVDLLKQLERKV
jgi:histidinol-phosphate aminotransferase